MRETDPLSNPASSYRMTGRVLEVRLKTRERTLKATVARVILCDKWLLLIS